MSEVVEASGVFDPAALAGLTGHARDEEFARVLVDHYLRLLPEQAQLRHHLAQRLALADRVSGRGRAVAQRNVVELHARTSAAACTDSMILT